MTLLEQLKQAVAVEDMDWIRQIVNEMEWADSDYEQQQRAG